jgi:uracil phosphoribosyltransferase
MSIHILGHPLAQHFITHLRDEQTQPSVFRSLCKKLTTLLAIEASRDLTVAEKRIATPLEMVNGHVIAETLIAVPILRAGLGMLDPFVELFPDVSVGYIGLSRDENTAIASSYYAKLPPNIAGLPAFILDPMLATGGSAAHAVSLIADAGPKSIKMLSIVAAPEGIDYLEANYPQLEIYTAALDRELNDRKYILPGLGDFGDRLYGT